MAEPGLQTKIQLADIGVVVLAALFFGIIATWLGFSSSIGYILAGIFLGPSGLNYLPAGGGISVFFGELGIMLLLFYLGLEMSFEKFKQTGAIATLIAFVQMGISFTFAFVVASLFGFGVFEAAIIASLMPMASTVMAVKFMIDRGLINNLESKIAISILIVEDFVAILVLVFISSVQTHTGLDTLIFNALLFTIAAFYVVSKASKHALRILDAVGQKNKMTIYAIGAGVAVAIFGQFLGLSPILGAYFAGFALAETEYGERIKKELAFFREFFILFFFVAFGATTAVNATPFLLGLLAALVAGNFIALLFSCGFFGTALGLPPQAAVSTGVLLSSIGEFSLIIAAAAAAANPPGCSGAACPVPHAADIVSLAFLLTVSTALVMPILFKRSAELAQLVMKFYPRKARQVIEQLNAEMSAVGRASGDAVLHASHANVVKNLIVNIVIAIAIVYVAVRSELQVSVPFLEFLPPQLTVGMLLLPLITWPIYKFVNELKSLVHAFATEMLSHSLPSRGKSVEISRRITEIFTGIVISLAGLLVSAATYYLSGPTVFLVIPIAYLILSFMYLSRSFYGLLEHYESLEGLLETGQLSHNQQLLALSREFNEHARQFKQLHAERMRTQAKIHAALQENDLPAARHALSSFRRFESQRVLRLLKPEYVIAHLPPAIARKYPQYAKKLSKFDARDSFHSYLERNAVSPAELKALKQVRQQKASPEKEYESLSKIGDYLSMRATARPQPGRAPQKIRKRLAKVQPKGRRALSLNKRK